MDSNGDQVWQPGENNTRNTHSDRYAPLGQSRHKWTVLVGEQTVSPMVCLTEQTRFERVNKQAKQSMNRNHSGCIFLFDQTWTTKQKTQNQFANQFFVFPFCTNQIVLLCQLTGLLCLCINIIKGSQLKCAWPNLMTILPFADANAIANRIGKVKASQHSSLNIPCPTTLVFVMKIIAN